MGDTDARTDADVQLHLDFDEKRKPPWPSRTDVLQDLFYVRDINHNMFLDKFGNDFTFWSCHDSIS